jgi:hypothetical protein
MAANVRQMAGKWQANGRHFLSFQQKQTCRHPAIAATDDAIIAQVWDIPGQMYLVSRVHRKGPCLAIYFIILVVRNKPKKQSFTH